MSNKALYEAVALQLQTTWDEVSHLSTGVDTADSENTFGVAFSSIFGNLSSIQAWAQTNIDIINQEEAAKAAEIAVMNSFLSELKVVFEKYSASAAVAQFESGYGVGYGEPGTGFVLTTSFEGTSATKEIKKSVIVSGDLA